MYGHEHLHHRQLRQNEHVSSVELLRTRFSSTCRMIFSQSRSFKERKEAYSPARILSFLTMEAIDSPVLRPGYRLEHSLWATGGQIFLTGTQAHVRLLLMQRQ